MLRSELSKGSARVRRVFRPFPSSPSVTGGPPVSFQLTQSLYSIGYGMLHSPEGSSLDRSKVVQSSFGLDGPIRLRSSEVQVDMSDRSREYYLPLDVDLRRPYFSTLLLASSVSYLYDFMLRYQPDSSSGVSYPYETASRSLSED